MGALLCAPMGMFSEVDLVGAPASGRLLLHSMPGRFEPIQSFLAEAKQEGINCILCLVADGEIERKSPDYRTLLTDGEFAKCVVRSPIEDFGVPRDRQGFAKAISTVAEVLYEGRNLLIHCAAGVGRTGTAASCLLVELGFDTDEALDRVCEAGSNPETDEQEELVRNFAEIAKGG